MATTMIAVNGIARMIVDTGTMTIDSGTRGMTGIIADETTEIVGITGTEGIVTEVITGTIGIMATEITIIGIADNNEPSRMRLH
jgi:hypothetical protein